MKKQLLNESEVRKLMKFANLGALSENFVQDLEEEDEMTPEEDAVELVEGPLDAPDLESPEPLEEPEDDTPPEDDMPMDVEAGEEEVTAEVTIGQEEATALIGLLDQLKDAVDVPGEAGEEEEMAMAPEPDEGEEEVVAEEELEESDVQLREDDDIVNEVTRRVAKRLLTAKRQN